MWDVTVGCPLIDSYVSSYTSGAAAGPNVYLFLPLAFENFGTLNLTFSVPKFHSHLSSELGCKIRFKNDIECESSFLFQHLFVTLQRFNYLLNESFAADDGLDK